MTQRMDYEAVTPAGVRALDDVCGYVFQSGLPKTLIDLVYLRVSQINGCAYTDMYSRDLLKAGVMVEKLALLPAWREGGELFDESERAALAWAETVTRVAETGVPDAEYEDAAAVFDQKELADLTIAIGLINAYNRMAISFRAHRRRPHRSVLVELSERSADSDGTQGTANRP
jgi:AhpD family alkylhydroperoxidase